MFRIRSRHTRRDQPQESSEEDGLHLRVVEQPDDLRIDLVHVPLAERDDRGRNAGLLRSRECPGRGSVRDEEDGLPRRVAFPLAIQKGLEVAPAPGCEDGDADGPTHANPLDVPTRKGFDTRS